MKKLLIAALVLAVSAVIKSTNSIHAADPVQKLRSARPPNAVRAPTIETTTRMRDEAGRVVDWGSAGAQINEKVFINSAKALTRMFQNDEGAVMCQGAAYYLHLIYLEAGYRSYLVGFKSGAFSHAMVLVEIETRHKVRKLVVQDPTFNLTYVDGTGEPMSIFEIMSKIAAGNHEAVVIQEGAPVDVDFLQARGDPDPTGSLYVKESVGRAGPNNAFLKYRATISLAAYAQSLRQEVAEYTAARGKANNVLYTIFDDPLYVYKSYPMGAEDQKEADELFGKIKNHHAKLTRIGVQVNQHNVPGKGPPRAL